MSWTEERVELLRKLWTEGLSASQIAAELGGVTRNAVIGKVHRIGLSGRPKNASSHAAVRQKRTASRPNSHAKPGRAQPRTAMGEQAEAAAPASQPPRAPQPTDVPKPEFLMLDLLELTEHHCKFPLGDPQEAGFGFCGAPAKDGETYCAYHCRIAYQPAADRRRDRSARGHGSGRPSLPPGSAKPV